MSTCKCLVANERRFRLSLAVYFSGRLNESDFSVESCAGVNAGTTTVDSMPFVSM